MEAVPESEMTESRFARDRSARDRSARDCFARRPIRPNFVQLRSARQHC